MHGALDDVVFMEQPTGFHDKSKSDFVCQLSRSLYGLRQAPHQWYKCLLSILLTLGFRVSPVDYSLFLYNKNNVTIFALVYVDYIIITGSNMKVVHQIIQSLHSRFMLKDLGKLNYFLGMEASWTATGLLLTQ